MNEAYEAIKLCGREKWQLNSKLNKKYGIGLGEPSNVKISKILQSVATTCKLSRY